MVCACCFSVFALALFAYECLARQRLGRSFFCDRGDEPAVIEFLRHRTSTPRHALFEAFISDGNRPELREWHKDWGAVCEACESAWATDPTLRVSAHEIADACGADLDLGLELK